MVLCYKSRNEEIDEALYSTFENLGFEGEQANGFELDEKYLAEPIDIFILNIKEAKNKALDFP